MLRSLIATPLILIAIAGGVIYAQYGEVDPCRVLAKDRAQYSNSILPIDTEGLHRLETSQYSTGKCAGELSQRWWNRLIGRKE